MSEPWPTLLIAFAAVLALFLAMWLVSLRTRDVGAVDIVWGPGFALVAWIEAVRLQPRAWSAVILLMAVTLWAIRLGAHLFSRHRLSATEDARYAAMRAADPEGFPARSLWTVFVLQAVILFGLSLPIHLAMTAGPERWPGWLTGLGLALFVAGFALETWADRLLLDFRRDPANRGGLLTSGPFAWSRHPNYFGECVLWFGLGLIAWDASGNPLALLGPAALTALILKVSGPPLKEAHLATRPGYAEYAARTSRFVPWPPRG